MKIQVDGFDFEFPDALDAFIFDETDRSSPNFHGLSHAMKAVDMIVELENDELFMAVKDFHRPDDDLEGGPFNHLRKKLNPPYRPIREIVIPAFFIQHGASGRQRPFPPRNW